MGTDSTRYSLVIKVFESETDYEDLNSWWQKHGSCAPALRFLPKTGFVVLVDGVKACAGFLYKTDSKLCVFEFVVCNPDVEKEPRGEALDMLIRAAQHWAKSNNFEYIYTCANIARYKARLVDNRFVPADGGQQHFLYEVK